MRPLNKAGLPSAFRVTKIKNFVFVRENKREIMNFHTS